jgi:tRNA-dihydrouridine synthase 4
MVKQAKERTGLPCSIKIRVDPDMTKTIELVKRAEAVGCAWIAVHGRTMKQRSTHPVDYDAIKMVKENLSIPVIANGDVWTLQDAHTIQEKTGVNGVMAARGILQNPALFAGYSVTPPECIADWMHIGLSLGMNTPTLHQHLMFMLFQVHNKTGLCVEY